MSCTDATAQEIALSTDQKDYNGDFHTEPSQGTGSDQNECCRELRKCHGESFGSEDSEIAIKDAWILKFMTVRLPPQNSGPCQAIPELSHPVVP